jgi:hypothetical protein
VPFCVENNFTLDSEEPETPDEAYRWADRFDRIVYGVKSTSFLTQNYNRYSTTSNANGMKADYGESMHIEALLDTLLIII